MPNARNSAVVDRWLSKTVFADARLLSGTVCAIAAQTTIAVADNDGDWIGIAPIPSDAVLLSAAIHHAAIAGATNHRLGLRRNSPADTTKLLDISSAVSLAAAARAEFDEILFHSNTDTFRDYWGKALWELPTGVNAMTKDPNETFWLTQEMTAAGTAAGTVNWRILYTVGQ